MSRRPVFVPLLHRLIDLLHASEPIELNTAGQPLELLVNTNLIDRGGAEPTGGMLLERPDGSTSEVFAYEGARGLTGRMAIRLRRADHAGHYTLRSGNELVGAAGVNIDRREIEDAALSDAELDSITKSTRLAENGNDADSPSTPYTTETFGGTPLWPALLGMAAIALLGESALLAASKR